MNRRGTLAVVGGAVLVMAVLLVAALADPVQVLSRPRSDETAPPFVPASALSSTDTPVPTSTTTTTGELSALSMLIGVGLHVLLALFVLAVLFAAAVGVQAIIRRRPRLVDTENGSFVVPPVPEELLHSVDARMSLLGSGEPRNAIVAAWLDLETAAATSGLPRERSETSTEYTTRVIGTWEVDRERLLDLAQLYREARFSLHPLGEEHRRRAIADLEQLHADLERAAATAPRREEA